MLDFYLILTNMDFVPHKNCVDRRNTDDYSHRTDIVLSQQQDPQFKAVVVTT